MRLINVEKPRILWYRNKWLCAYVQWYTAFDRGFEASKAGIGKTPSEAYKQWKQRNSGLTKPSSKGWYEW